MGYAWWNRRLKPSMRPGRSPIQAVLVKSPLSARSVPAGNPGEVRDHSEGGFCNRVTGHWSASGGTAEGPAPPPPGPPETVKAVEAQSRPFFSGRIHVGLTSGLRYHIRGHERALRSAQPSQRKSASSIPFFSDRG